MTLLDGVSPRESCTYFISYILGGLIIWDDNNNFNPIVK